MKTGGFMRKYGLFLILLASFVSADRGMLPVLPNVSIYEPGQKAIIGWNGKQEVMILAVDAYADTECKVLEILPLPSEPKIEKADIKSFEAIQELIAKHAPISLYRGKGLIIAPPGKTPGVEILFHKKIGAHNITCAKALKYQEFVDWIYKFTKSQGIDTISLPPGLPHIIKGYLGREIPYFVFDIIELDKKTSSVAPLRYEFASPYLFFPLCISRLAKGDTKIQLFILTEHPPWIGAGNIFKYGRYRVVGEETEIIFELTKDEIRTIEPSFVKLLPKDKWLTALTFEGPTLELREDLNLRKFYKIIEY